jgi:hypothetical protein
VSYTTTVILTRAWLTDPADPFTSPITAGTRTATAAAFTRTGAVRIYAGGRRQAVGNKGRALTKSVTFVGLSYAQMVQLTEDWIGRTLLYRSKLGERFFCAYFSVPSVTPIDHTSLNDGRGFDITLDLVEVDFDESAASTEDA